MDNIDYQLKDIFSQLKNETVPGGFQDKVMEKIETEKERKSKQKEDIFQILIIVLCSIGFIGSMFLLNRYFFNVDIESAAGKVKNYLTDVKVVFGDDLVYLWSVIGLNAVLLILLEQFLSRKLSKKN